MLSPVEFNRDTYQYPQVVDAIDNLFSQYPHDWDMLKYDLYMALDNQIDYRETYITKTDIDAAIHKISPFVISKAQRQFLTSIPSVLLKS